MSRRIFIAGEKGQVAKALSRAYASTDHVVLNAGRASLDICDPIAVCVAIAGFRPDLVVNAAAYTSVDRAEDEPQQAFSVNRDGARHIAASAHEVGAPIIHLSTDYVFDGNKTTSYLETDKPNPLGIYGKSKLAGEVAVARQTPSYIILRTSWVFSADGTNFVRTMLRLATSGSEIGVVDDQSGAPTFAADLAAAIVTLGEAWLAGGAQLQQSGLYHVAGSGATTWCQFARAIMEGSAARGGPTCPIRAIGTSEFNIRARRPKNSRLDCTKLEQSFGIRLPPWQASLDRCLDELIASRSRN